MHDSDNNASSKPLVLDKSALAKFARLKLAPSIYASLKSEPTKCAEIKDASSRFAALNEAWSAIEPSKLASVKFEKINN